MYETFFGLKHRPFLAVPDTESYFSTNLMEKSSRDIEHTVRRGGGIALLIGASGTGKTLLLRLLRKTLKADCRVLLISNGHLTTPKEFFQQLLYDLELPFSGSDEIELRLQLLDYARQQISVTDGIVILIDEAQFLDSSVLEEIRLLMNCDNGSTPFFRFVLAGTVELEEKLTHPQFNAFNQRVVVHSYLEPFSNEETRHYIDWQTFSSSEKSENFPSALGLTKFIENSGTHEGRRIDSPHLKVAELIFTESAKRQIFLLTEGLPRLINQLCDIALQLAAERILRQVDEVVIHSAWARLQQHIGDDSAEPVPVIFSLQVVADIDEIVARKKATFQPKKFDSTIEFGILNDSEFVAESISDGEQNNKPDNEAENELEVESGGESESVTTIRFRSSSEYKPPYPEDDEHWEWERDLGKTEESFGEIVDEIAVKTEPEPAGFYEELITERLFSPTDLAPIRQLPLSEELDEAIDAVAESVTESERITESAREPAEEFFEEMTITERRPLFYPHRRRLPNAKKTRRYRSRKLIPQHVRRPVLQSVPFYNGVFNSCIRRTSASLTRCRFIGEEGWIGNVSFCPLFIPSRLSTRFCSQPETEIETECYSKIKIETKTIKSETEKTETENVSENIPENVIENEGETEEIIGTSIDDIKTGETRKENGVEESEMDEETLEKYSETVLEGRPPFVRKEPVYAYQTTGWAIDSVQEEYENRVPYPASGNEIQLHWRSPEHGSNTGIGTPYREFLSRENPTEEPVVPINEKEKFVTSNNSDLPQVVHAAMETPDKLSKRHQYDIIPNHLTKTSLDESFDEEITVENLPVFSNQSDQLSSSFPVSQTLSLPFLRENILPQQIIAAINRITEAAEKIEQAAKRSEDAGQQIKQVANLVETEVKTALPAYMEFFQELSEFQKTISVELDTVLSPKKTVEHRERSVKLLPFSIRANFSTINTTPIPSSQIVAESDDEKTIDFQKLFQ